MELAVTYKDRDNSFIVTLKLNGSVLPEAQMSAISRFEVKYGGTYYNSDDYPSCFSRSDSSGQVTIKPYGFGLEAGSDLTEFIVYDEGDYQHGLVWDQFKWLNKNDAAV